MFNQATILSIIILVEDKNLGMEILTQNGGGDSGVISTSMNFPSNSIR